MSHRLTSISSKLKHAAIAVLFLGALGLAGYIPLGGSPSSGDEWRRTANGWERIGHWQTTTASMALDRTPLTNSSPGAVIGRFDTHPAGLALVQLVAVLLALYSFPSRLHPSAASHDGWLTLLARSFRASAFGS
jgi:hypothetical protein